MRSNKHILVLDGLRFCAAFFVLAAHGMHWIISPHYSPLPYYFEVFNSFSALGMTLFFVLSGFVIHYNYHNKAGALNKGALDFFIARFARLYPLFFILFAFDFVFTYLDEYGSILAGKHAKDLFTPLPYLLTFTQEWFYKNVDSQIIGHQYGNLTTISWSLSTESFFYVTYMIMGFLLLKLNQSRKIIISAVLIYIIFLSLYLSVWSHSESVNQWAVQQFGLTASNVNYQNSFLCWFYYHCPMSRIGEFLLGTLAAQLYLHREKWPCSTTENKIGRWICVILVIIIPCVHIILDRSNIGLQRFPGSLYAPLVACLIYCFVRFPQGSIQKLLCSNLFVKLGESSYSIYLLHAMLFPILVVSVEYYLPPWALYLFSVLLILYLSRVSYLYFERPSMLWIKYNFRKIYAQYWLPVILLLIILTSNIGANLVRNIQVASHLPGKISMKTATIGFNTGAQSNNLVYDMMLACDGLQRCEYNFHKMLPLFSVNTDGTEDLYITWGCNDQSQIKVIDIKNYFKALNPIVLECNPIVP